jgi:hypothetical protein
MNERDELEMDLNILKHDKCAAFEERIKELEAELAHINQTKNYWFNKYHNQAEALSFYLKETDYTRVDRFLKMHDELEHLRIVNEQKKNKIDAIFQILNEIDENYENGGEWQGDALIDKAINIYRGFPC